MNRTTHTEVHKLSDTLQLVIDIERIEEQPWHGMVKFVDSNRTGLILWRFERPQYETLDAAMDAVRAQVAHKMTQLSGKVVEAMNGANHA
jgi:hypothetical protein